MDLTATDKYDYEVIFSILIDEVALHGKLST